MNNIALDEGIDNLEQEVRQLIGKYRFQLKSACKILTQIASKELFEIIPFYSNLNSSTVLTKLDKLTYIGENGHLPPIAIAMENLSP